MTNRLNGFPSVRALTTGLKSGVNAGSRFSTKTLVAGTIVAFKKGVQATFFQKVLICAFAGFLAAALVEWAKVFVEGADDALNKGYKHHAVLDTSR